MDENKLIRIYTDGCCLHNPGGAGGWGAVLIKGNVQKWANGAIPAPTTSNRAELTAMIEALKLLTKPCDVIIYSDSQVSVNGATGEYGRNSNLDLWDKLDIAEGLHKVDYQWVKGHVGNPLNERAHSLAERGARGDIEPQRYVKDEQ